MTKYAKRIEAADNVVTVLAPCVKGDEVVVNENGGRQVYVCNQDVPFGHKIAAAGIGRGKRVVKYGETIGRASRDIKKGDWVHTHNIVDDYLCLDKSGRPLPGQKT